MDIQPQTTKPISDDQELAKVLAGISSDSNPDLNFEETPVTPPITTSLPVPTPTEDLTTPIEPPKPFATDTSIPGYNPPVIDTPSMPKTFDPSNLDSIKKNALIELRPLVDKLNLEPDEKFDIYLLLLRSTDDKTLIAPAHEAARNITDESKRAQALLEIIKEIDFLSSPA